MTERLHFHFSLSCIGEENCKPLQCSCLENLRDSRAWWATVDGVTQSQTRLKWLSSSSSSSFLSSPTLTSIHDQWKTIALTRQTFAGKVRSLLLNMLSMFVITFLPRSKSLLISWVQSPSTMILELPQNKVSHCFPIYLTWSDGTGCHDLSILNVDFFTLLFHFHQEAL